jgi:hypothetical protein
MSFLNTGTILSPTWSLIGSGVTETKINYNPQVTEETYISDENATLTVENYAPKMPVTAVAMVGDDAFDYIDNLRMTQAIAGDAETELVNVYLYTTPALTYYKAEKFSVSVQVDDDGGAGGESLKLNYTINFIGAPVEGGFSPTGLEFVALPVNAVLTTMVIGSVTLAPLFATDKSWLWYAGSVPNGTTTVTMTSTLVGATIVQKDDAGATVAQAAAASLNVGVNNLTIEVTVGSEAVIYKIDITRAAA